MGMYTKWSMRIFAMMGIVAILVWYTRRRYYLPQRDSHRETYIWDLPDHQVNILRRSAGQALAASRQSEADAERARIFTSAIIFPANVRQRLTERYEPGQRTLIQQVSIDVQLHPRVVMKLLHPGLKNGQNDRNIPLQRFGEASPKANEQEHWGQASGPGSQDHSMILFPILVPRKGELVDNLHVRAADGSELPVLSYRQYLQLVARSLRTLLDIAYSGDISEQSRSEAFEAEQLALRAIMRRTKKEAIDPSSTEVNRDQSGVNALRNLAKKKNGATVQNHAAISLAVELVNKLSSHYAVVAAIPCPPEGKFVISYERMMTPSLALAPISDGILSWLKARARLLLGSRPVDFTVTLDNACTTQSYHLFIDAQDGVFVGVQESDDLVAYLNAHWRSKQQKAEEDHVLEPSPPPYYRFRRRAGQRYAHFYARFFPAPMSGLAKGEKIPEVRFRFYEVPPGSVFRAVITATAAALLIWLIGFVTSRKPDPGTDVPAFLLVFPAVAAAWLGFDGQPRRLIEGTLAARISLVATVLCSIAACGLFMIFKAGLPYLQWELPVGLSILGITSTAWGLLCLTSLANASTVIYAYLARTWEFMHLSNRPDSFGGAKENIH
ncbi:hypothetical protein [Micromonospora sp. NPDC049374]|uniref:hypothetical protein n=1 Tax=Micromonospora sp. NPDC049374 TaxID=3154352 RepID=UPI003443C1D9